MNAKGLELARVLELACRAINPPYDPRIDSISLDDLGGAGLTLDFTEPRWRSSYLRGLKAVTALPSGGLLPLWPVVLGHVETVHALAVLADGRLASGSWDNTIQIWSREASGTWRSEATIKSQRGTCRAIVEFQETLAGVGGEGVSLSHFNAFHRTRFLATTTAVVQTDFVNDVATEVRITPLDPLGRWQTIPNRNDPVKPFPCDPSLHVYAAFIGPDGGLFEVWERPDQYEWAGREGDSARTLILRNQRMGGAAT